MNFITRVLWIFFTMFLLLNSSFAMAYNPVSPETVSKNFSKSSSYSKSGFELEFQSTVGTLPLTSGTGTPIVVDIPQQTVFSCKTFPFTEEETQRFLDLVESGVTGNKISSGSKAITPEDRESIGPKLDTAVLKETPEGYMGKVEPSNKLPIAPEEISHMLNTGIKARAFSFGLVLDDTKRVGRCNRLDENTPCPVEGKTLLLRNSGAGIIEDFAPFTEGIKSLVKWPLQKIGVMEEDEKPLEHLTQEDMDKIRQSLGLPKDKDVNIPFSSKLAAATPDDELIHFRRKVSDMNHIIHNYLRSDDGFAAKFTTNCNISGSSCTISLYSMFDKYYNQWYSGTMVLSTFAPALLNRAGKLLTKLSYSGEAELIFGAWPWSRPWRRMVEHFRVAFYDPYSSWGFTKLAQRRAGRIFTNKHKYPEIGKFVNPLLEPKHWTGGYLLTKGTEFRQWFSKEGADMLKEIAKQPVAVRKAFLQTVKDLRGLSRTQASKFWIAKRNYLKVYEKYGYGSAEEIAARIKYGIDAGKAARGYDATVRLDIGEWLIQKDEFADLYPYFIKLKGQDVFVPLYRDPAQLNMMEAKFWRDGHFAGAWPSGEQTFMPEVYETTGKNLNLYKPKTGEFIDKVNVADIERSPNMYSQYLVELDNGHIVKANHDAIELIKENSGPKAKVFEHGGYEKHGELKPEDFAGKYLSRRAEMTIASEPWRNMEQVYKAVLDQGFAGRRYGSWLDKAFSEQDELIKNYFNPLGGMKKTAQMYGYWYLKRGGVPGLIESPFSGYMLAQDMKTIKFPLGTAPLYNDAFIDFFAQEGSDQGDIFRQILSKLPWDLVLNAVTEKIGVANDMFKTLTGKGIRSTVENIVDFVNSPKNCGSSCYLALDKNTTHSIVSGKPGEMIAFTFTSSSPLTSDILEYIADERKQQEGTTLIAFARHTNIAGDKWINLVDAQKKKETCGDKLKEVADGIPVVGSLIARDTDSVGGSLALTESLGYYVFGLSGGLFLTAYQQMVLAPKLQDCVDTEGGYYAQISAPPKKLNETQAAQKKIENITEQITALQNQLALKSAEKAKLMAMPAAEGKAEKIAALEIEIKKLEAEIAEKKQEISFIQESVKLKGKTTAQLSTQAIFDAVSEFQAKLPAMFGSSDPQGAMKGLNDEITKFLKSNEVDNMVQASIKTQGGVVSGREEGPILFSLWYQGEQVNDEWRDEGQKVIESVDGKKMIKDYAKGSFLVEGTAEELIEIFNSDEAKYLARMNSTNTDGPFEEFPARGTRFTVPNDSSVLFELTKNGEFLVHDSEVLDCIQKGVMAQTGVSLTGNNLVEVFGFLRNIKTDMGYRINATGKSVYANGSPPVSVSRGDARAEVFGNRLTLLRNSSDTPVGKMLSATFDYGEILYKPDTDEFVMVLRRNKKAIIHQSDVAGLRPMLTQDTNPLTDCPEPAINLDALPVPGSELKEVKVNTFNDSLDAVGPFKVFESPTKRYVFYSKIENGECVPYFKIIDKATGRTLLDIPINEATLKQTPTGIEFEDMQGNKHKLDFSAENGIPKISYNGQPPETLIQAQGNNGAFWYDPNTGNWYPENGHLLPLIEAFRNGNGVGVSPNGNVVNAPSSNWQNLELKTGTGTPFNLPSMPEKPLLLFLFIALMLTGISIVRIKIEKRNKQNKKPV